MRSEEVFAFLLQENTFPEERIFLIIKCLRHSLGLILREMSDTQRYPLYNQELTRKPLCLLVIFNCGFSTKVTCAIPVPMPHILNEH